MRTLALPFAIDTSRLVGGTGAASTQVSTSAPRRNRSAPWFQEDTSDFGWMQEKCRGRQRKMSSLIAVLPPKHALPYPVAHVASIDELKALLVETGGSLTRTAVILNVTHQAVSSRLRTHDMTSWARKLRAVSTEQRRRASAEANRLAKQASKKRTCDTRRANGDCPRCGGPPDPPDSDTRRQPVHCSSCRKKGREYAATEQVRAKKAGKCSRCRRRRPWVWKKRKYKLCRKCVVQTAPLKWLQMVK